MSHQCDRRSFVKMGAVAGAAWALGRECFAADASDVKARPMDNVRVGLVGIGRRGSLLLSLLLDLEGVEGKAVCDIIPDRGARGQNMVTTGQ
ncbi:MAG: twin-arginine translocation signal domain-containing protein, partial [Planctomycetes bacterium]|nr:twin-arginine translocation signal domain-containing protein [Planctomycetota bacterium]